MFYFSTTQDSMVDTSKFISKGVAWNNFYAGIIPFEEMIHLSPQSLYSRTSKRLSVGVSDPGPRDCVHNIV
jgi:hypothetical protein